MSVTYRAATIIGVRIPASSVHTVKKIRGCQHDQSKSKFCQECGKATWVNTFADEPDILSGEIDDQSIGSFRTGGFHDRQSGNYFYGLISVVREGGESSDSMPLPDLAAIRDRCCKSLQPIGFWNADEFKIWTAIDCC